MWHKALIPALLEAEEGGSEVKTSPVQEGYIEKYCFEKPKEKEKNIHNLN